jgi:hypothetical protein
MMVALIKLQGQSRMPISTELAIRIRDKGLELPLQQYENPKVLDIAAEQSQLFKRLNELDVELLRLADEI